MVLLIENVVQVILSTIGLLVLLIIIVIYSIRSNKFKIYSLIIIGISYFIHATGQLLNLYVGTGTNFFSNPTDFDIYTHFILGIALSTCVLNFIKRKGLVVLGIVLILTVGLEIVESTLTFFNYPYLTNSLINALQDLIMSTLGSVLVLVIYFYIIKKDQIKIPIKKVNPQD